MLAYSDQLMITKHFSNLPFWPTKEYYYNFRLSRILLHFVVIHHIARPALCFRSCSTWNNQWADAVWSGNIIDNTKGTHLSIVIYSKINDIPD